MEGNIPCRHAGCPVMIKPSNWANHLLKCPYALIPCVFEHSGCKSRVMQLKIAEHIKNCAFAPRITVATLTTKPKTTKAVASGPRLIPCIFKALGCPAKILSLNMEKHKKRCPFSGTIAAPAPPKKVVPKAPPPPPPSQPEEPQQLVPCPFKQFGCSSVMKKSRVNHHASRCPLSHTEYCKLLGLSDCPLSLNGASWPAHASKVHGLPAVWTKQSDDFEVTIDHQKTGQIQDLEGLMSVDWKPVAIAVLATKPYALWLKTEIILGKRIAWMITHSGVNRGELTAQMTFYNIYEEKITWAWGGPVMPSNGTYNEKCFSIPCHRLFGRPGWRLRIRICEGTIKLKKIVNVCSAWKGPNDADTGSSLGSSTGINLVDQAGSSRAVAKVRKQSRGEEEMWSEANFPPQKPREFYLAMNYLLDSMNKLGTAEGNEVEPQLVRTRSAVLSGRRCIQCDGLITRLTAEFCDLCLESNDD